MKIRLSVAAMPIISDTDVPTLPSSMGCGKQGTWLQDVKVFNIMYFVSPCLSFHQTFLLSLCTLVFPFSLSLPFLQNARMTSILCCVPGVSNFYSNIVTLNFHVILIFFYSFFFCFLYFSLNSLPQWFQFISASIFFSNSISKVIRVLSVVTAHANDFCSS